jgi:hypothetical protein
MHTLLFPCALSLIFWAKTGGYVNVQKRFLREINTPS